MKKKRKKLEFAGDEFNHCTFDELEKDEWYLVFLKKDDFEKATVIPSLMWLDCPLTYCEPGDIARVEKVKVIKTYNPVVSPKVGPLNLAAKLTKRLNSLLQRGCTVSNPE